MLKPSKFSTIGIDLYINIVLGSTIFERLLFNFSKFLKNVYWSP